MENKEFRLSGRVTVLFEFMPAGYYFPSVLVDGEKRRIPLLFYPDPELREVDPWLKAIEGLDAPSDLAYNVVAGALSYSLKYPFRNNDKPVVAM